MRVLRPLSISIWLAATVAAQQPSYLRLPAVADAYANQDQPATNFGAATEVRCGKDFASQPSFRVWFTRGHFQFDLTALAGLPQPTLARVRVFQAASNAAGCLDACERGVVLVVYPEGVWYERVTVDDVAAIVDEHLVEGRPVARLQWAGPTQLAPLADRPPESP